MERKGDGRGRWVGRAIAFAVVVLILVNYEQLKAFGSELSRLFR